MKNANRTSPGSDVSPDGVSHDKLSRRAVWMLAARPGTLAAAVAPVAVGTTIAIRDGLFHLPSALVAAVGALLIQVGTNFANDYFDYVKGSDRSDRMGPLRVMQAGLVTRSQMRRAMFVVFGLAIIAGAYLVARGGCPILLIGLLSILFGVLYTAGPCPLGYIGLGDLFVLIFFGPVAAAGTYYVQALRVDWWTIILGLSPGLLSVAVLTVNNLRDIEADRVSGKRSLAVIFGAGFARWEYLSAIYVASVLPAIVSILTSFSVWSLLPLLTLIVAVPSVIKMFAERPGPKLNAVLAATGRLLFIYAALFALGWLL